MASKPALRLPSTKSRTNQMFSNEKLRTLISTNCLVFFGRQLESVLNIHVE